MGDRIDDSKYWIQFWDSLRRSIMDIESGYFQVERMDEVNPTWRERVYCYELYHQLRHHLPNGFPFTLHGELDKKGHGIIKDTIKKYRKSEGNTEPNPDFLVHNPGNLGNDLAVIEVKRSEGFAEDACRRDLEKLETFINSLGYLHGIFLVFGPRDPEPMIENCLTKEQITLIKNGRLHILYHKEAEKCPYEITRLIC